MDVQIKRNPQAGWETHSVEESALERAAYAAVRQTHAFLTDDNHTWEVNRDPIVVGETETQTNPAIVVKKNERSPARSALAPAWVQDGAGVFWFAVPFKGPPSEA